MTRLRTLIVAGLLLSACSGRAPAPFAYLIDGPYDHFGDVATVEVAKPFDADVLQMTITNQQTGVASKRSLTGTEANGMAIPVDAEHLPGLAQDGPELQSFDVTFAEGTQVANYVINVLADKNTLLPARFPIAELPRLAPATVTGTKETATTNVAVDIEAFASKVVDAWNGRDLCISEHAVSRDEIGPLPPLTPPGGPLEADTTFQEYVVRGTFPKRVVTSPWTPDKSDALVMTPKAIRFVLAKTDSEKTIQLLQLTALRDEDLTSLPTASCTAD
ncbi:MAG TPA: hypothetical protein V6D47_04945 [Oscillatoriaceae cyanobacterium]